MSIAHKVLTANSILVLRGTSGIFLNGLQYNGHSIEVF
jgi:hypothetical protein